MSDGERALGVEHRVGLCARCEHARCVVSSKGSEFWLCELSKRDERFAKYPRLPVVGCRGFQAQLAKTPG